MKHAIPILQILLPYWLVEPVSMTRGLQIGGRRALAEHRLDRVSGHKMDQQKDGGDHQP